MALRPALQRVSCLWVSSGFPPAAFRPPTSPGKESCRLRHSAWRHALTRLATGSNLRPSFKPSSPPEFSWAVLKPFATVCLPGGPTVYSLVHGGQATGGCTLGHCPARANRLPGQGKQAARQACHRDGRGGRPAADSTGRRSAQRRHRCRGGRVRGQAVPCPRRSPGPAASGVCCRLAFVFMFGNLWDVPTQASGRVMVGACIHGS